MDLHLSRRGISLPSVLVAFFLLSILTLAVIQMLDFSNKGVSYVVAKSRFQELGQSVTAALEDPDFCRDALWNGEATPATPSFSPTVAIATEKQLAEIRVGAAPLITNGGSLHPLHNPVVELTEADAARRNNSGGLNRFFARLRVSADLNPSDPPYTQTKDFFLYVFTHDSGASEHVIEKCQVLSTGDEKFAWIPVETGAIQGSTHITYPAGEDRSPETQCQNAGFTTYAGPCKAIVGGNPVQGALIANRTWGGTHWAVTCIYGNGATYISSDANSQILCIK